MEKFRLTGKVTINVYTDVEAETLDKAIKLSKKRHVTTSQWGQEWLENEYWLTDKYEEVYDIKNDDD